MSAACPDCAGRSKNCPTCNPAPKRPPEPVTPGPECRGCRAKDEQLSQALGIIERLLAVPPVLEEVHPLPNPLVMPPRVSGSTPPEPTRVTEVVTGTEMANLMREMRGTPAATPYMRVEPDIGGVECLVLRWMDDATSEPVDPLSAEQDMFKRRSMLVEPAARTEMMPEDGGLRLTPEGDPNPRIIYEPPQDNGES